VAAIEEFEVTEPVEEVAAVEEIEVTEPVAEVAAIEEFEAVEPVEEVAAIEEFEAVEPVEEVAPNKSKKSKKDRRRKKAEKMSNKNNAETVAAVAVVEMEQPQEEIDEEAYYYENVEQEELKRQERELEEIEELLLNQQPFDGEFEDISSFSGEYEEEKAEVQENFDVVKVDSKKPRKFGLAFMCFCAALIGLCAVVNSLFEINSDQMYKNIFYVDCATDTYAEFDISEGALILSSPIVDMSVGTIFSYSSYSGECLFAIKTSDEVEGYVSTYFEAESNGETLIMSETDVRGKVQTIVPVLGTVLLFIQNQFINIVLGLGMMIAISLILILFGFKKVKKEIVETENDGEEVVQFAEVKTETISDQEIEEYNFEDINSFSIEDNESYEFKDINSFSS
ncbi:MAG: hypothetical protein R3Y27_08940, partial [Clostridia bacterium]